MKTMFKIAACAFVASLAACGGQARAQSLANQVKVSATASMDISHARAINVTTDGAYIVDQSGAQRAVVFDNLTAVTNNQFFTSNYLRVSGNLYYNATAANIYDCVGSNSTITWGNGQQQAIADGCAISDTFKAYARR